VHVAHALDAPGPERRRPGDEHAVADADGARIRVHAFERTAGGDPLTRGGRAVDGVEFDLDELLRPGQAVDGNQGGGGPRVLEMAGDRASRRIRHGDVGDVDAAADHVVQAAAGLAYAPISVPNDGMARWGAIAHAMDVALPVDRGRARLQHGVADAHGPRVVRKLLELAARGNVEPTWWCHGGHGNA